MGKGNRVLSYIKLIVRRRKQLQPFGILTPKVGFRSRAAASGALRSFGAVRTIPSSPVAL